MMVFGKNYQQIGNTLYTQVSTAAEENGTDVDHEFIPIWPITITEPGYVYIYVSNENGTPVEVFFDDFKVTHIPSDIVQKDDYYPFGERFNSYSSGLKNTYLFNGKENLRHLVVDSYPVLNLYDFGARLYDPTLGRWTGVDPLADERDWPSPYNFVQNNPMLRVDPDGMLDEFNFNVDTGDFDWISDKGGDERQYVNVVNNQGDVLGAGSVQGSEVYAYRLRESVALTNYNAEFDDRSYNRENGHQYSLADFQLRNEYRKTDNVFGRFVDKAERAGKAQPVTSRDYELRYGYLTGRLRMMGSAIGIALTLVDPNPVGKPFLAGGSRFFSRTISTSGSHGVKALSSSNNSWVAFMKANKGKYSGTGWQKKAAADYYKSPFYQK